MPRINHFPSSADTKSSTGKLVQHCATSRPKHSKDKQTFLSKLKWSNFSPSFFSHLKIELKRKDEKHSKIGSPHQMYFVKAYTFCLKSDKQRNEMESNFRSVQLKWERGAPKEEAQIDNFLKIISCFLLLKVQRYLFLGGRRNNEVTGTLRQWDFLLRLAQNSFKRKTVSA